MTFLFAPAGSWIVFVGDLGIQAVWTAYSNCVLVTIYYELRAAKEGADSHQVAAVFD